jgi:hypothetical protein
MFPHAHKVVSGHGPTEFDDGIVRIQGWINWDNAYVKWRRTRIRAVLGVLSWARKPIELRSSGKQWLFNAVMM